MNIRRNPQLEDKRMQYQILITPPAHYISTHPGFGINCVTKFCLCGLLLALSACSLAPQGTPAIEPFDTRIIGFPDTKSTRAGASSPGIAKVPVRELEKPASSRPSNVEVIWAMPAQPVDGFVLHYGLQKELLDRKVKLPAENLEMHSDPGKGLVYRYVLQDVAPDKPVFVAVSAFASGQESPPSDVYEVTP